MSGRRRVAITTEHSVDGPARETSIEDLQDLLDGLGEFGPEPEGVVVEIDEEAIDELPDGWEIEEIEDD